MKAKLLFFNFLFLVLFPFFGFSQCITDVSWTITSPTCLTNGIIAVSATGSNLQYTFLSYPTCYTFTGPTSNTNFTSICAGNYTLYIEDTSYNCDTTVFIQVNINYIPPGLYNPITTATTTCNNNGIISGTISNGSLPYIYEILSGPSHVGDTNSTGTFTNLVSGTYVMRGTDNCGVFRTDTCYLADSSWLLTANLITRLSCTMYNWTASQFAGTPSIVKYIIKTGGIPIDSTSSLPFIFNLAPSAVNNTEICVRDILNCEHCLPMQTNSNWSLGNSVINYSSCNVFTVSSINIIGSPIGPLMYGFVNDPTSGTNDTIWSSIPPPFSISQVPYDGVGYVIVKDGCGVINFSTTTKYMDLTHGYTISLNSCAMSSISVPAGGSFIAPVTYTLNDSITNNTGTFTNLLDGIYTIKIKDFCGDSLEWSIYLSPHYWQSKGHSKPHCDSAFFDHDINIVYRMKPPISIVQCNSFYIAIDSQSYTLPGSFIYSFGISDSFSHVTFTNTLPSTTYHYIVKDDCNRKDTITLTNAPFSLTPTILNSSMQSICTNKGQITCTYNYFGPIYYPIKLTIRNYNSPGLIIGSASSYLPTNSVTWGYPPNYLDTGTYIIKMELFGSTCTAIYDTVVIPPYQIPQLLSSQFLHITPDTIECIVNPILGIPPYMYSIVQTIPPGGSTGVSSFNTFYVPDTNPTNPITLIQMQVTDACNNSVLFNITPTFALSLKELKAKAWLNHSISQIEWTTLDEENMNDFIVQRSLNGHDFNDIQKVKALGNTIGRSSYKLDDDISNLINYPIIYYRIIANDYDVNQTFSNIVYVQPNTLLASVLVFPTLFNDKIHIHYVNNQNSKISIKIYDIQQRLISSKIVNTESGLFETSLDNLSSLSNGIYLIQLIDMKSGERFMQKVIKE